MVQWIKIFQPSSINFFDFICCVSNKSNELKSKNFIVS